jgi:uncharacterized membrane protein (DUF4010 family)
MYNENIEVRLRNYWCRVKALGITYSDYVSVALVIRRADFMCCIFIGGFCGSTVFSHIISKKLQLSNRLIFYIKCVLIFCTNFV